MKVLTETSVLISASVFWEVKGLKVKHPFFDDCNKLFEYLKNNSELGIITRTVENEAKSKLDKAVFDTIRQTYFPSIESKIKAMTLQDIITNDCFDRLENFVEECSTRLPINISERDKIKNAQIEPFLKELVKKTVRYIQPHIPSLIHGRDFRGELTDLMVKSLPSKGIIYKGMPEERDLTIMAEATQICRKYGEKEKVFVASMDYHFRPNRVQIGSYLSGYKKFLSDKLDSTVRDELEKKFGFIGETPLKILEIAEKELKTKEEQPKIQVHEQIVKVRMELEGTLEAVLFNEKMEQIERLPVRDLADRLQQAQGIDTVVFDGVVTQRLIDIAAERGIKRFVAARVPEALKTLSVHLLTFTEIDQ